MTNFKLMLASLLLLTSAAATQAQDNGTLDIRTIVQKEVITVADDGTQETRLVPADLVVPGEEVIYTLAYSNVGDQPAENIVITNPLPAQLTYIEGTAEGADGAVEFSVDGGASYGQTNELTVVSGGIARPARAADVTHIRWVIGSAIQPGEEGTAQFRARLN